MCTRYYVELSPERRPYVEAAGNSKLKASMISKLGKEFKTSGEIRPTDMAAMIATGAKGNKTAFPMVWGYHIKGIDDWIRPDADPEKIVQYALTDMIMEKVT